MPRHQDRVANARTDLGLIERKAEGKRKTLTPIARFAGIEVDLGAAA